MLIYTCPACERGNHAGCHGVQSPPPGVFGGSKCDCQQCEDARDEKAAKKVVAELNAQIEEARREKDILGGIVEYVPPISPLHHNRTLVADMLAFPVAVAAKLCGLSKSTLYEDIKRGLLRKTARGIITRRELERYLNASLVKE